MRIFFISVRMLGYFMLCLLYLDYGICSQMRPLYARSCIFHTPSSLRAVHAARQLPEMSRISNDGFQSAASMVRADLSSVAVPLMSRRVCQFC